MALLLGLFSADKADKVENPAIIDFDGVGPVMEPISLAGNISSICCALLVIYMTMKSPVKTPPALLMMCCCCLSCSSSASKLVDDTMNRFSGKNDQTGPSP
jgi:hypothetical protein